MAMNRDGKYVNDMSSLPQGEHYAILYFESIWIPGDERSRTNPGHGYPEHSESVVKYVAYTDRQAWEDQIQANLHGPSFGRRDNFKAIHVRPAQISTKVEVKIS